MIKLMLKISVTTIKIWSEYFSTITVQCSLSLAKSTRTGHHVRLDLKFCLCRIKKMIPHCARFLGDTVRSSLAVVPRSDSERGKRAPETAAEA
jgi:hypothetical protein